jgi:hypothetical protein
MAKTAYELLQDNYNSLTAQLADAEKALPIAQQAYDKEKRTSGAVPSKIKAAADALKAAGDRVADLKFKKADALTQLSGYEATSPVGKAAADAIKEGASNKKIIVVVLALIIITGVIIGIIKLKQKTKKTT